MKVSTPNYSEITLQKVFFTFNWNLYLAQQWVMRCITESQPLILNPKKCMVSVRLKVPPIIDQIGLWLLLQNSTTFDLLCCWKILNWILLDLVGVMCLKATAWDFKSWITSPNVSTLLSLLSLSLSSLLMYSLPLSLLCLLSLLSLFSWSEVSKVTLCVKILKWHSPTQSVTDQGQL